MDYKKESGKRLRAAREAQKWTLRELSAHLRGILSESRLSNYEQGIRMMGPEEALALSRILGVEASYLLCVETQEEEDMTQDEAALLKNYRALPEKDRNEYSRRIELLAQVYREPFPDDKLPAEVRKGTPAKRKSPAK